MANVIALSEIRTIYFNIDSICTKWVQYREAFDGVMHNVDLTTAAKMTAADAEKQKFSRVVADYINSIYACMNRMLEVIDTGAIYNPADPALHNALTVVKNPDTPWTIIEQTRAYFMGNDAAMKLLAAESAEIFKGYFEYGVYDANKRYGFHKAMSAVDGLRYGNVTPDAVLNTLADVDSQVRLYMQLRCIEDVNLKATIDRIKEELVTARVINKNNW